MSDEAARILDSLAFLEDAPDIVYRLDGDGRLLIVNRSVTRLLGYDPADLAKGRIDYAGIVHPDDLERVTLELRMVRAGRSSKTFEIRIRRKGSDEYVWLSNLTYPVRDEEGRVTGYGGVARDITRHIETSASLARRNFELITINTISTSVHAGIDVRTRLENFTAAFRQAFEADAACAFFRLRAPGYSAPVRIDEPGLGIDAADLADGAAERIDFARRDRPLPGACPVVARGFTRGFSAALVLPLVVKELGEGVLVFFAQDIDRFETISATVLSTIRLQLVAALENSIRYLLESLKAKYISILKDTASALINIGGLPELLNVVHYHVRQYLPVDRLSTLVSTGADSVKVIASAASVPTAVDGQERPVTESPFRETLALPDPLHLGDLAATEASRAMNQSLVEAGLRTLFVVPLLISPEVRGAITFSSRAAEAFSPEEREFLKDIARIVSLAVVNLLLKDELKFQSALTQEKNTELQNFVYTISHDLKTPLFSILGLAQILKEELATARVASADPYLDRLLVNAARMDTQIKELVTLSKIGMYTPKPEPLDLGVVVREALAGLDVKIRERKAEIAIAEGMPAIATDRALLGRILENMIDNAIKYVPRDRIPTLAIGAAADRRGGRRFVRIVFSDNGCGIAERDREKIFTLFSRLKTVPDVEGTGAGLSIVKRMVEKLGGTIGLESTEGVGSRFAVEIPG